MEANNFVGAVFHRWRYRILGQSTTKNSSVHVGRPKQQCSKTTGVVHRFWETALKLIQKHGSLENVVIASQTRTVVKPYIQEALAKYREALYRNLRVRSLQRDLDITLVETAGSVQRGSSLQAIVRKFARQE